MKKHELNTMNAAELKAELARQQDALAKMRFDLADKKLKRTSDVRSARRTIARLMTALKTAK
jgi:ribosomal protein L29